MEMKVQMGLFLEQMMKFSMTVMVSSMEAITKTMQEMQQKAESPDDVEDINETDGGQPSSFSNVSRLAIVPFFEMSKLPMTVFASVIKTISQTQQEIRASIETDNGENSEEPVENYDKEIVSLDAQEVALETKALFMEEVEEVSKRTLWQIGRSGRSDFGGKWTAVFDYHVGTDIDEINSPNIPHLITVQGGPKSKGATEKLNIHFTLDRDYPTGELIFSYDRWGGEKDQVFVDDELLAPISGVGKGKFKHVALSLNDASNGDHVITITTSGETASGGHRIDYVKLAEVEKPVAHG
jgi:hypothetical protein